MAETKLSAEKRTEFGKGAARRIRRDDKIPAVVYGHGEAPLHVTLPGHATMMALKHANALLSIDVEGENHLTLPKDVQRDPIKGFIEHVDLIVVSRGEKVSVDVPLALTGEAAAGTIVNQELTTLSVEAEATHLPETLEVSVEGLEAGSRVAAGDVTLPEGTSLAGDPEQLVVVVQAAATAEQAEAELESLESEAGIVREEPQSDDQGGEA
ncbi:50S ribosomal protein L25/general stress protein Ctc [Paenibacillus sp. TRM 82003]|uniref:50S ribosomal protein L25/general stress protein Ctc n=1 Tax=Kineococcus sp. TRM81007 TaxID=2925831 RepID=UPI001F5909F3|nr:50S ribosomal protein L25/general stress protein Ctc [Kineococcus sp. TRM81007]MCI2238424.1 50S ribosomal protein L25/general stress protein Ctc [Kineococcus sp. TRM81007]MCI3922063.1 50S ribosomal protein L25/general stress protein Ctc [Paenibacillus sp. TRM 82003]